MRRRTLDKRKCTPRPETKPDTDVHGLVRRLVKQVVANAAPAVSADNLGEVVILDVQLDGVRCQLVRAFEVILSPREREIARMVAKGYPNKTMAAVLEISVWTVGAHLRRIFTKLGIGSRAAMVARLMEIGMLE
jgi:DNA-binding CsgD family transcriptional regulator